MIEPGAVAARLDAVRSRIAAAGGDDRVTIVAVTKGFDVDAITAARAVGLFDVGENYAQELLDKHQRLATAHAGGPAGPESLDASDVARLSFHFIGRLQRNKVRALAGIVALWQSVDRLDLAVEIARRAPGAAVLVQLNLSGEGQKGGCDPAGVAELVDGARGLGLDVRGLMGVAPAGPAADSRPGFDRLVALADALDLPVRSIGMSGDLEMAVQAGSTMVRVGTSLFGPRPARPTG